MWPSGPAGRLKSPESAQKELRKLDKPVARRITRFLSKRLAHLEDPRSLGEALKGSQLGDFWKYRVDRLICALEDDRLLVLRIGHRREIHQRP
jgi:mRNA interferase RelE/StbE